jgi:peptidoglycan/LPS O-acetylase OafA/YrhL
MNRVGKGRILELDGLRAFAVAAVILYHLIFFARSVPYPGWLSEIVLTLGINGVNIFFVISGFIITMLLLQEQATHGKVNLAHFYIRRVFRIFPALLVYVGAILILRVLNLVSISYPNFAVSLLFLGNFSLFDSRAWLLSHTWSLAVEEQYYLFFPPLLVSLLRFRMGASTLLFGALYVLLAAASPYDIHRHDAPQGALAAMASGLGHMRYILVGVLLALYRERAEAWLRKTPALLPIGCVLALVGSTFWHQPPLWFQSASAFIQPWLCGILVLWFPTHPETSALLRTRPVQWLGLASYSFYLWQQLFTGDMGSRKGALLASPVVSLVGLSVCATLSYYLVERFGISLGRRIASSPTWRSRRPASESSASPVSPEIPATQSPL